MTQHKKNTLPIVLGLSANALKGSQKPFLGDDAVDDAVKQAVFERDDHCCGYCGFKSEKYQKVNVINGKWSDTSPDNLVTSCIFCYQCFYLDQVSDLRSGVFIWLPEMTQAALNHLLRAIYVARITQGPVSDYARQALELLMARREDVKQRIQTDDPAILSMVYAEYMDPRHYSARKEKLKGVRLLPLDRRVIKEGDLEFNQFPQILAYWRSKKGPFADFMPDMWLNEYSKIVGQQAA